MMKLEQKLLRMAVVLMLVITVIMSSALFYFPNLHAYAQEQREAKEQQVQQRSTLLSLLQDDSKMHSATEVDMPGQLRLQLPQGIDLGDVLVTNDYMNQMLMVTIPGIGEDYFDTYPLMGSCDHIVDLSYDSDSASGSVEVMLDGVYEPDLIVQDGYLYLGFVDPHEIYDYVVVIDAGHGGSAPGATKQGVEEKDIDLQIIWRLKELFDESDRNIGVYYTRLDDSNPSFASRVDLANLSHADLFLSVHNNSTASGRMSSINGTQVMYSEGDDTGASEAFAQHCLEALTGTLQSQDKGLVEGDEIYIIRSATMPVALAEVGFMTNQKELEHLKSEAYQGQAAQALYQAIITTLEELHEE